MKDRVFVVHYPLPIIHYIPGIHLVHKPVGPTSFSIVRSYIEAGAAESSRRPRRICHGGTLDPFASGLLLILVEPATRLFDYLHGVPKIYDATIRWGVETDNGDPHGQVTFTGDPANLSPPRLDEAVSTFIGWHDQIPPAHSAKRIDGERAYLKAHRGETVVMSPSRVYLHEAGWLDHDLPRESRLRVTVRGGYYIRALARDLGRLLGCGAHIAALHRISIGPWTDPGPDQLVELHRREILPWLPSRLLSDQDVGDLRKGGAIPLGELIPPDWPLPVGFAESPDAVRGFHQERFCFLLAPGDAELRLLAPLRGGL